MTGLPESDDLVAGKRFGKLGSVGIILGNLPGLGKLRGRKEIAAFQDRQEFFRLRNGHIYCFVPGKFAAFQQGFRRAVIRCVIISFYPHRINLPNRDINGKCSLQKQVTFMIQRKIGRFTKNANQASWSPTIEQPPEMTGVRECSSLPFPWLMSPQSETPVAPARPLPPN